jgi:nucleoside-diphosphate-sugar epimerase
VSTVVVTGANGLVGARFAVVLADGGATVRAVVRRLGTAPAAVGVEEWVGDFADPGFAATLVAGAAAVVSTVHPMRGDRAEQHHVSVDGTAALARTAALAGVDRLVHVSTSAVYHRPPGGGDVDERSALVGDDSFDYAVTKRDADLALASSDSFDGLTRILLRPPAILGPGPTSTWNTLTPAAIRDNEVARHAVADKTFPWVHLTDLATLAADLATGRIASSVDAETGPVAGECTPVNVSSGPAVQRDYYEAVTAALGVAPVWDDEPAWRGQILADRAGRWGWTPTIDLPTALAEIAAGL